jgi:hypothetical protein
MCSALPLKLPVLSNYLQALNRADKSITNLKRALSVLPKENLSSSELQQKRQYESSLEEVEIEVQKKKSAPFSGIYVEKHLTPWKMVEQILPELVAAGPAMHNSSVGFLAPIKQVVYVFSQQAWVIRAAYLVRTRISQKKSVC